MPSFSLCVTQVPVPLHMGPSLQKGGGGRVGGVKCLGEGRVRRWVQKFFIGNQEGGGVSKEITGSVLTTSMTSRLASVVFKMVDKVIVEEAVKNIEFARKKQVWFK